MKGFCSTYFSIVVVVVVVVVIVIASFLHLPRESSIFLLYHYQLHLPLDSHHPASPPSSPFSSPSSSSSLHFPAKPSLGRFLLPSFVSLRHSRLSSLASFDALTKHVQGGWGVAQVCSGRGGRGARRRGRGSIRWLRRGRFRRWVRRRKRREDGVEEGALGKKRGVEEGPNGGGRRRKEGNQENEIMRRKRETNTAS